MIENSTEGSHLVEDRGKSTRGQWCRCGLKVRKKDYLLFQKQETADGLVPHDPGMGVGALGQAHLGRAVSIRHALVKRDLQGHIKDFRFYFKDNEKPSNDFRQSVYT